MKLNLTLVQKIQFNFAKNIRIDIKTFKASDFKEPEIRNIGRTVWDMFRKEYTNEKTKPETDNSKQFNVLPTNQIPYRQGVEPKEQGKLTNEQTNILKDANQGVTEEDIKKLTPENDKLLGEAMQDLIDGKLTKEQYLQVRKILIGK